MNVPALIRTYVPLALSVLFGWLVSLGVNVSDEAQAALTSGVGAVLAAVYYTLVKKLETRFPQLTVLLGSTQQPVAYAPTADTTVLPVAVTAKVSVQPDGLAPLDGDDELEPLPGRHAAADGDV